MCRLVLFDGSSRRQCRAVLLVLLSTAVMLPGCSFVGRGGAPEMSFDINKDLKELTKHFDQAAAISEFYKNPTRSLSE